jgi:polyisoprenyl-teichoic acid--peptidoglycan teichoic acid transferase
MSESNDDLERGEARRSDRHRKTGSGRPVVRGGERPPVSGRRRTPTRIERVQPRTGSAETVRESQRRRRESSRIVTPEARKRRRRRRLTVAAAVVLVLVLGGVGWAWAFVANLSNNIHPVGFDSVVPTDTPAPPPGKPFYMVIMGVDTRPGEKVARSDTLIVAYVDPPRQRVTTMSIPRDTRVTISGRGKAKINEAMQLGGPRLVIKTVKEFTGLPITHYAYINFDGFKDIVDAVGGVDIYVPVAIDDIQASGGHPTFAHIRKGWNHLDGGHALTFVRARHQFADQDFSRMKNQQAFLKVLAKQAMTMTNPFKLPGLATAVSKNVQTDLSLSQITGLAMNFKGMDERNLQSVTMPGVSVMINGISFVQADQAGLHEITSKMEKGELFVQVAKPAAVTSATVKPSDITLTIRNGAGINGLAKIMADKLIKDGYKITATGNMGQYVYGTTSIVYHTDADAAKAIFMQDALGVGNLVPSRGMYSFQGDLMIIIGKDFDPKKFGTTATKRR